MSVSYESIQERAPNGVLSPEMAAQLLAGMPGTGLEGETGAEPEPTAASPTAAPATDTPLNCVSDHLRHCGTLRFVRSDRL